MLLKKRFTKFSVAGENFVFCVAEKRDLCCVVEN